MITPVKKNCDNVSIPSILRRTCRKAIDIKFDAIKFDLLQVTDVPSTAIQLLNEEFNQILNEEFNQIYTTQVTDVPSTAIQLLNEEFNQIYTTPLKSPHDPIKIPNAPMKRSYHNSDDEHHRPSINVPVTRKKRSCNDNEFPISWAKWCSLDKIKRSKFCIRDIEMENKIKLDYINKENKKR